MLKNRTRSWILCEYMELVHLWLTIRIVIEVKQKVNPLFICRVRNFKQTSRVCHKV